MAETRQWFIPFMLIVAIVMVEVTFAQLTLEIGLTMYTILTIVCMTAATLIDDDKLTNVIYGVTLATIARLVSISLASLPFPPSVLVLAYVLCLVIASIAYYIIIDKRTSSLFQYDILFHGIGASTGIVFGLLAYFILLPPPFPDSGTSVTGLLVLALVFLSGIIDGFIIYTIILSALTQVANNTVSLLMIVILFMGFQLETQNPVYVLLIIVQVMVLGRLTQLLRSSKAAVIAQGLMNLTAFGVLPLVIPT